VASRFQSFPPFTNFFMLRSPYEKAGKHRIEQARLLIVLFVLGTAGACLDHASSLSVALNTLMTMQALGNQMGSIETGCVGVSDNGRVYTTMRWLKKNIS
jgi:hypothetical protein